MDDYRRRLLWHGVYLFLLGLLTGFLELKFNNPRMGLAAHLEGLMNGIFLIALGAIWAAVQFAPRLTDVAYWTLLYDHPPSPGQRSLSGHERAAASLITHPQNHLSRQLPCY